MPLQVDNYFIMAGFNSGGVALSGGAGRLLAERMVTGFSNMDTWVIDPCRFSEYHNNKAYLRDRVTETEGQRSYK